MKESPAGQFSPKTTDGKLLNGRLPDHARGGEEVRFVVDDKYNQQTLVFKSAQDHQLAQASVASQLYSWS